MTRREKVAAILGIIGFIGAVAAGFLGALTASWVMLGLLALLWMVWVTREVLILRRGLRPATTASLEAKPRSYLRPALVISSTKRNDQKIDGGFLRWDRCMLLLWVLVPARGEGLRDSPHNRYLLAHTTGKAEEKSGYCNQFCLRHSSARSRWDVEVSDASAKYGQPSLAIEDGLDPGWHHFLLAWDRSKPELVFLIDSGSGGSDRAASFRCWPQQVAENVYVGGWVSGSPVHYCETALFHLQISDQFLGVSDPVVANHLQLRPRA